VLDSNGHYGITRTISGCRSLRVSFRNTFNRDRDSSRGIHSKKFELKVELMRIGILPSLAPSLGGVYQYSLTILQILDQWRGDGGEDHFVLFTNEITHPAVASVINGDRWTIERLQHPSLP